MSKNRKSRNRGKLSKTPKLSLLDKFIYTVVYSLSVLPSVAVFLVCIEVNEYVTYNFCSDAIAYNMSGLIFLLAIPCVTLVLLLVLPLNKKYKLGIPLYKSLDFAPAKKTKQLSNDLKKYLLIIIVICFLLNITCLFIPLKHRTVLTKDADIILYPIVGKEKILCSSEMLSSIECDIYYRHSSSGSVGKYIFTTKLCYATGERISFDCGSFKSFEVLIRFLERIKSDKQIGFYAYGAENITAYANETNLSSRELQLLSNIFS